MDTLTVLESWISPVSCKVFCIYGDWNAEVGKDAQADWGDVCGRYCNVEISDRGLRLLEFATATKIILTNTLGPHKPFRRWK